MLISRKIRVIIVIYILILGLCVLRLSVTKNKRLATKSRRITDEEFNKGISLSNITQGLSKLPDRQIKRVKGYGKDTLLFSAIVGNSTDNSKWDRISVITWELKEPKVKLNICCVFHASGKLKGYPVVADASRYQNTRLFVCSLENGDKDRPKKVTVSGNDACSSDIKYFVDVEYAFRYPTEIAIFAKVIYGDLSAVDLLVWFEVHRLLGFHKVFVYPYDLNPGPQRVLEYYKQRGLLEIVPFQKPGKEHGWKKYPMEATISEAFIDKEIAIRDGHERLKGFKYVVSFDVDEYIVPVKEKTWMQLFDRLFTTHPDAAGFFFETYLYVKDWGVSNKSSPFVIGQYSYRSEMVHDRVKHVTNPRRLDHGGLDDHYLYPAKGFSLYTVREEDGAMHHFRKCRPEWRPNNPVFQCTKARRIHDTTMLKLLEQVKDKVMDIAKVLEL